MPLQEADRPQTSEMRDVYSHPRSLRYALAFLLAILGWLCREALTPWIGPLALPFIFFFPAVVVAAWFGGLGPAICTLVVSALASEWFFLEPIHSLRLQDPVPLSAFLGASAVIIASMESLHRARIRALREIEKRIRSDAESAQSRDLLATTLISIGDGVIVTDSTGTVTILNTEAERLTGWKQPEAVGQPLTSVFRIVNENTRAAVENPVEKVIRQGTVVGLANHTLLLARDGSETPIDDSAAPVRRTGGPILGIVLVFRDFTERRRAALAQSRLAAIVESSGDAIVSKNLEGTVLTWNQSAVRMFGYQPEEIIGRPVAALVPEDLLNEETEILDRLRQGKPSELIDTIRVAKDGRRIPVSVSVSPIRDVDGRVVGASKIVRDMTAMVAARDALLREKELLATTLRSIGDAVIATDSLGRVTFMNPIAASLTGWAEADAIGRLLTEVFQIVNEKTRRSVENPALRAIEHGVIIGLANHTVLISKSGEERAIDDSAAPIRSGAGPVAGAVLVFRDVTERRKQEEELRSSRERLNAHAEQLLIADRRKSEFLAILAHELRNPMAAIQNSVSLLQMKGPPEPELESARKVINRQLHLMARLLGDLLDVNRLEHHRLELRREPVDLASIIERALETARPIITQGGHELSVHLPSDPVVLDGDPVRLAQVFANLLSNAAKYMDPGGKITLHAAREGNEIVVSVKDRGIGIAASALPDIFKMFSQLPSAKERSQGGIGVGLALAKGIVELHGGMITARSEGLGRGSEFIVRLPIAIGAHVPAPHAEPTLRRDGVKRRVLVVDDLADGANTMAAMLRLLGHEVHVAYDGESAIAAVERLRPEIVFLDIGMPKMDGYEVCRWIRAQPWGRSLFLIAQTGWGQEQDRRSAVEAGFDQHVLKPVDLEALLSVLSRFKQP